MTTRYSLWYVSSNEYTRCASPDGNRLIMSILLFLKSYLFSIYGNKHANNHLIKPLQGTSRCRCRCRSVGRLICSINKIKVVYRNTNLLEITNNGTLETISKSLLFF